MTALPPGTWIGAYRVSRHLGSGRVADVYEAWSQGGEQRALKRRRPGLHPGKKAHDRLCQEADASATIEHVHVVRYFDGGLFEGRLWIVVELVLGTDLQKLAEAAGGRLPVAQVVGIMRQVCEGVAAAHRNEIVHRDLKPENILVTPEGLAKVGDFGSAKPEAWGVETTQDQEVSTARYRAPEYVRDRIAVPASDVFSIGVVLYELLSGRHPVADEPLSVMGMCMRLLTYQPPATLASLDLGIPGDLSDLVQRALAGAPEDRPSAREMADALEGVLLRLRVGHRAAARSLPRSQPDTAFARTERAIRIVGPRGTRPMAVVSGSAPPAASERSTTLPPVPPETPVTAPSAVLCEPVEVTVPMAEVPAAPDRRTSIPVEQAAPRPSAAGGEAASRRRASRVVTAGAVLLALGIAGAAWRWIEPGGRPPAPASAPPPAAPAPPSAAASAAPAASSSAAARAAPPRRLAPRHAPRP
jgi:serine/threonine-protein kinase